jgi:hypothetical protein
VAINHVMMRVEPVRDRLTVYFRALQIMIAPFRQVVAESHASCASQLLPAVPVVGGYWYLFSHVSAEWATPNKLVGATRFRSSVLGQLQTVYSKFICLQVKS